MHAIVEWEAARSGAGITVAMIDAGGVRRKQLVKKIVAKGGAVTAVGGDGARFPLSADNGETSAEVASAAGELLNLSADDLDNIAHCDTGKRDELLGKVHKVAASALGQRAD